MTCAPIISSAQPALPEEVYRAFNDRCHAIREKSRALSSARLPLSVAVADEIIECRDRLMGDFIATCLQILSPTDNNPMGEADNHPT
jgi:hypothetical protein